MFKNTRNKWLFHFSRKRRHNSSQQSGTKYREMLEESVLGMYIIQENRFKYVNKKWCEIMDYTSEEVIDRIDPSDTVYPDDRKDVEKSIEYLFSENSDSKKYEFRAIRKNKETIWLEVYAKIMMYEDKPALFGSCTDVTKQKEIERALLVNEERLRLTLETTKIGIWDWDLEKDVWHASPVYHTMLGYKPIKGPSDRNVWLSRLHPDDREMVKEKIINMRNQRISNYSYQARILHADGTYKWHEVLGHIVEKDKQGRIKRMVGIRKDISDFKLAEEEQKKSQTLLRTLIDTIPDLVWLKDPQGVYLQCNPRFEQLYGTKEEDIIGKTDYDFVSKELADFFRQKDNEARVAGKPTKNEEEIVFFDGHKETLETIKTPLFGVGESVIGVLGIGRDISERKKIEQTLRENQRFMKTLISNLPGMVYRCKNDSNWSMVFISEGCLSLTGYKPDYIINSKSIHYGDIIHGNDRKIVWETIQDKVALKEPYFLEYRITHANGSIKWVWERGRGVFSETGALLFLEGFITDITEKKNNERELEKHRQNLENLVQKRTVELEQTINELKATIDILNATREQLMHSEKMASLGVLSSGIAHEINNPLNFIHGGSIALTKYLKDRLHDNLDDISPYLEAINEGVNRASRIVQSLGHYSKSDDLPAIKCDIHSIIDNCLLMLENKLKSKVTIKKQYTNKEALVTGNEGKLHQAFLNIILNSAQAIKNEGTIEIKTIIIAEHCTVIIRDTGEGMDQKTIDRIFDPFFTTKATGEGTGLGMYVTYNIILEHYGKIKYESEINKGTKVIINLPIQ